MKALASRLLALFAVLAYVASGLGPRGAALCLGGGHSWDEMVAAHCDHGGHTHGPHGPIEPVALVPPAGEDCNGCHHHDSDHDEPCTDIPFDQDEARPSGGAAAKLLSPAACDLPAAHLVSCGPCTRPAMLPGRLAHERLLARRQVSATLRAVVLII